MTRGAAMVSGFEISVTAFLVRHGRHRLLSDMVEMTNHARPPNSGASQKTAG